MISRATLFPVTLVAAVTLTACGGESGDSSPTTEPPSSDVAAEVTIAAPAPTAAAPSESETTAAADNAAAGDGCNQVMTPDEIGSILGTTPEISGSSEQCLFKFRSDAIGSFSAYSGSKADEALDTLMAGYQDDDYKKDRGVLLDDGRGYFYDENVVVRGDSGRVFVLAAPTDLGAPDYQVAMQALADLLLTR